MPEVARPAARPCPGLSRRKCHTCELVQFGDELVLEFGIAGVTGRHFLPQVVPLATADHGRRLVAYCQPGLGTLSGVEIHRRAHLRAHPAGIDRIAQGLRPESRHCERQRDDLQLAFGVGLCRIPRPLRPIEVRQRTLPASMPGTAEANQPSGTMDQRRQDVRRQRVEREDPGVTYRLEPRLASMYTPALWMTASCGRSSATGPNKHIERSSYGEKYSSTVLRCIA
jgi:hypothetical protein